VQVVFCYSVLFRFHHEWLLPICCLCAPGYHKHCRRRAWNCWCCTDRLSSWFNSFMECMPSNHCHKLFKILRISRITILVLFYVQISLFAPSIFFYLTGTAVWLAFASSEPQDFSKWRPESWSIPLLKRDFFKKEISLLHECLWIPWAAVFLFQLQIGGGH
jgi:hypothetical protein